jgi:two-component system, NtrC family, response regulator AlgB
MAEWLLKGAAIRSHKPQLRFTDGAVKAISDHRWPGNVRELRNVIERAAILSRGEEIMREDLPDTVFRERLQPPSNLPPSVSLEEVEREYIRRVLTESTTLEEAAATLGVNVTTLWRKRKRYGID